MPAICYKCEKEIPVERITSFLVHSGIEYSKWTCGNPCTDDAGVVGFMSESVDVNGKASRKTGYELNILHKNDPNYQEKFRILKRGIRRAR